MSVYKLYSSGAGDATASIDIQEDGVIEGVQGLLAMDNNADNATVAMEISFASTSGFTANDTRASFFGMRLWNNILTSGGGNPGTHSYVPMAVPVQAGERVYLHTVGSVIHTSAFLHVRDSGARRRPNMRGA